MLLIIDGNNLAHRCLHTFSLTNPSGIDVSVTYGFFRTLASYMRRFNPTSVLVAWDGGIPEFRRAAVPEYKANRRHGEDDPEAYADFIRQMNELTEILPYCGVLSVKHWGAEADDIMAQASKLSLDGDVRIVTSDKDLLQCVSSNVKVIKPGQNSDKTYDGSLIQDEFGIRVDQFVDWRAIQGDGSDNIPGVYGLGEKTATALFAQYGNLSQIIYEAKIQEYSGKLTEKMALSILDFGVERIGCNILVMHLGADRVGAKYSLFKAINAYGEYDSKVVKQYLMKNGFASLMDGSFYRGLMQLEIPEFDSSTTIPMVIKRRY